MPRKVEICTCFPCHSFSFHATASTDLTVNGISLAKSPDTTAVSGHRTVQEVLDPPPFLVIVFVVFLAAILGRIPQFFPGGVC